MSIVIIGGNERMESEYKEVCKAYNGKAKIFTKTNGSFKKKIGSPDLMIMFTNTVSHKMVIGALNQTKGSGTDIRRTHSSSVSALKNVLEEYSMEKKSCHQN